jgi:hypothetical protein
MFETVGEEGPGSDPAGPMLLVQSSWLSPVRNDRLLSPPVRTMPRYLRVSVFQGCLSSRRRQSAAMTSSSRAWMTTVRTGAPGALMSASLSAPRVAV